MKSLDQSLERFILRHVLRFKGLLFSSVSYLDFKHFCKWHHNINHTHEICYVRAKIKASHTPSYITSAGYELRNSSSLTTWSYDHRRIQSKQCNLSKNLFISCSVHNHHYFMHTINGEQQKHRLEQHIHLLLCQLGLKQDKKSWWGDWSNLHWLITGEIRSHSRRSMKQLHTGLLL